MKTISTLKTLSDYYQSLPACEDISTHTSCQEFSQVLGRRVRRRQKLVLKCRVRDSARDAPSVTGTVFYQLVKMFQTASQSQKWSLSTLASCQVSNGAPRDRICSQVLGRRVCERRTSCDRDQPPPPSTQPTVCNSHQPPLTNQPNNQLHSYVAKVFGVFLSLTKHPAASNPPSTQPNVCNGYHESNIKPTKAEKLVLCS